jgi:hypothetical protein
VESIFALFHAGFPQVASGKAAAHAPLAHDGWLKDAIMGALGRDFTALRCPVLRCAICNVRKEKRFCPAVHGRICPQCCGEQREVTLDCPSDCVYLQQARQHEAPRHMEDLPADDLFPAIETPDRFLRDHEPLLLGVWHTLAQRYAADRNLTDREVISALGNMAKSYQTLVGSGLVYQEAVPGLVQQAIIDAFRQLLQEFRELEQKHLGYARLKDAEVLQALVFTLRLAYSQTSGRPRSRRFLDFLRERFSDAQPTIVTTDEPSSRIIMP